MLPVQGFISTKEHLLPLHEVEVSPKEVGLFKHLVPILWRAHQETDIYLPVVPGQAGGGSFQSIKKT